MEPGRAIPVVPSKPRFSLAVSPLPSAIQVTILTTLPHECNRDVSTVPSRARTETEFVGMEAQPLRGHNQRLVGHTHRQFC